MPMALRSELAWEDQLAGRVRAKARRRATASGAPRSSEPGSVVLRSSEPGSAAVAKTADRWARWLAVLSVRSRLEPWAFAERPRVPPARQQPAAPARRSRNLAAVERESAGERAWFAERLCLPGLNRLVSWALSIGAASATEQGAKAPFTGYFWVGSTFYSLR